MKYDPAVAKTIDLNPAPVTVTITPGDPPRVQPDPQTVHLGKDEEVHWVCRDATGRECQFRVIFKAESPFRERAFSHASARSGRVRPDVRPDRHRRYAYTVVAEGTLDPEVIVDY